MLSTKTIKIMSFHENNLLSNVHKNLSDPTSDGISYLTKGTYKYYHYGCDNLKDMGWGCGYRTLQTICSWIRNTTSSRINTPSIPEIQRMLVEMEDKPKCFLGSRDWIGSVEVCLVIDKTFDVPCKILHVNSGKDLPNYTDQLVEHFKIKGSPIMMGGDKDCSSKGIMGIHVSNNDNYLLIVDPHFVGTPSTNEQLQRQSWVKWQKLSDFFDSSFYNFCIPQLSYNK